jgi:hypothetical protein
MSEVKPTDEERLLNIEEIASADDTQYAVIDVPEWKGKIRIGTLPAGTLLDWVEANTGPAKRTAGIRLVVESLVDANGKRIGEPKHIEIFKRKDSRVMNRIANEVLKLNGLAGGAADSKKIEEQAGNASGEAHPDASPTASQPS